MLSPPLQRRALLLLLVLTAVAWFGPLDHRDLTRPDEGRYAEIAREMTASGDWLTPRLNDFKYFEKPALHYWATATAFSLFGLQEWAARLWVALTGFGGILMVYYTGRRLYGPRAGLYAAAVTASSTLYVFLGHFNTLDMGLSFFLTVALCAFLLAQGGQAGHGDGSADVAHAGGFGSRRGWMLLAWAAAALAVLSKGLVGAVLPAGALALHVVWQGDWSRLKALHAAAGAALFLFIAAPWFVAVSIANAEFFQFFFIHEHFERFLTTTHGRYEPPWYFIPVLLAGFAPWTLALFPALVRAWRTRRPGFHADRFLLAWSVFMLVFFSASSSKLPSYILPVIPALALLTGAWLAGTGTRMLAALTLPFALVGAAMAVLAPRAVGRARAGLPFEALADYVPWLVFAGLALVLGALGAALLAWAGRRTAAVLSLSAGALVMTLAVVTGHQSLASVYSAASLVERARPQLQPHAPFYAVNTFDHTLPFYLGRTVTMVNYKDELATAIAWEPGKFLPDLAAFERAWTGDAQAQAVFAPADFQRLPDRLKATMQVVASDPRRILVRKSAPLP